MSICHYCKQKKKLIKAHILPKAFFEDPDIIRRIDGTYPKKLPIGFYDDSILCAECDRKIGVYDQHAIEILLKKDLQQYKVEQGWSIPSSEYNYQKLKKFFISLIWRASISSITDFEGVSLGEKYTQLAYSYITDNIVDNTDDFSIYLLKFTPSTKLSDLEKIYISPTKARLCDVNYYKWCFCGYDLLIKVDARNTQAKFGPPSLSPKQLIIFEREFDNSNEEKYAKRLVHETGRKNQK